MKQGTRRGAILHSVGANASHGLRRTNADKRRAMMALLNDDEWRNKYSNYEMAKLCHVSESFVRSLRTKRSEETEEQPPTTRTYTTKHGTTATIRTEKIGKHPEPETVQARKEDPEEPEIDTDEEYEFDEWMGDDSVDPEPFTESRRKSGIRCTAVVSN